MSGKGDLPAYPMVGSDFPEEDFQQLRRFLLTHRQFDIGLYKDQCIRRRIARRMRLINQPGLRSYLGLLSQDAAEVDALMAALSVHVSQFFRNPSTFRALEETILPALIARAVKIGSRRQDLLFWSVGCAGGEEPYSLALILDRLAPPQQVAILGTDLSPEVLEQARQALFDPLRLAELSEEMRERYFIPAERGFRLQPRIRGKVSFAQHDILADAPFPTADLILCRNVLIYFSYSEQEKILCRLAAALRPGGYLVLGKAESLIGEARRQLQTENPEERIYRKKDPEGA